MAVDQTTLSLLHVAQTTNASQIISAAVPTFNTDYTNYVDISAQAVPITGFALSGTPLDGQSLTIRILDNGTTRAITWGALFEPVGAALLTTTTPNKRHTLSFRYSVASGKWGQTGAVVEA